MKRKHLILVLTAAILTVSLILLLEQKTKPKTIASPPAAEHGSATTTVGLNNTERLSAILLPEEFSAVKKALSNYIHSNVGVSVVSADLVPGSTKLNQDATINFDVKIANPRTTFTVLLQRPSALEIDFSVIGNSDPPISLFPFSTLR